MAITFYELCGADEGHVFSPHCWKTRMSLAHKGLEFTPVSVPFTRIAEIEGGMSKTVPVIKDGDVVMNESLAIAQYLDETYPDQPSLLGGEGGMALTRFITNWAQTQLHPLIGGLCLKDIHDCLAPVDQSYFRGDREPKFKMTLEQVHAAREAKIDLLAKALLPLKLTLKGQKFIGGDSPMFVDYVVFGPLQWLRTTCSIKVLSEEGEIADWFNTLLDMNDGMARGFKAAA